MFFFQELIYHALAFLLLLISSIILIIEVTNYTNKYAAHYEAYLVASILGLINSGLYLLSALLANRHYRGL